jgi:hypothetical protein
VLLVVMLVLPKTRTANPKIEASDCLRSHESVLPSLVVWSRSTPVEEDRAKVITILAVPLG